MFASKVAKPQNVTASSTGKLAARHLTPAARPFGGGAFDEQAADRESPAARGATPGVSWDFGKIPLFSPDQADRSQPSSRRAATPVPGAIQTKLAVGQADDPLEHEADRVADQVMRMPTPEPSIGIAPPQLNDLPATSTETAQKPQPKQASAPAAASDAPAVVHDALRSAGQPLDPATREFLERRLEHDFSDVRVHTDALADTSARSVNALAYTHGREIAFRTGHYAPQTAAGRRLLAHELVHVKQQSGWDAKRPGPSNAKRSLSSVTHEPKLGSGIIQRVPAAPGSAAYDRSKVAISDIPDFVAIQMGKTWLFPMYVATVSVNEPAAANIVWELYDPSDQMVAGAGVIPGTKNALTDPFVIDLNRFKQRVVQGRYMLRCTAMDSAHKEIAYADRSFFIWTKPPESGQVLTSLNAIKAAPATHSFGEIGAADARAMMLEHQASLAAGGSGTVQGTHAGTSVPAGVTQQDCTSYVISVLGDAFRAKGKGADWRKVMATARAGSGTKLKGTEVLKALESVAGWKGVFWSPDPRNPADTHAEHPDAYKRVKRTGQYYGIDVDKTKSIIDYRKTAETKQDTWTDLDRLKKVPLGVIAARGGDHMTLILDGQVYEVHWDKPASDPNVIEATPLEKWAWLSGVIVMPAEDFANAF